MQGRGPWLLAGLVSLLAAPALSFGLQADDHAFLEKIAIGRRWSLFTLTQADMNEGWQIGAIPWWSSPRLAIAFFRPLTSVLQWLEFRALSDAPWAMLLVNILLYAALVFLAARLYQRLVPQPAVAALAGLMFAIDAPHAMSVGWIAGANTLLASLFSLAALSFHIRARDEQRWGWQLAASGCVALALVSAEAGLWSLAYVVAYAYVLEQGTLQKRLLTVAPELAVGVLWVAIYVAGGFGSRGSGWYRELSDPLHVLTQGTLDLPLWVIAVFGPAVVSFMNTIPLGIARLAALPYALLVLACLLPVLRQQRDSRFFALALLLCVLPLFTTIPQDRPTFGASFGAFGWLAYFLVSVVDNSRRALHWARNWFQALHVWFAIPGFVIGLGFVHPIETATRELVANVKPGRQIVLVNSPLELLTTQAMSMLDVPSVAPHRPSAIHQLYAGGSDLRVERIDAFTLDVRAKRGWAWSPTEHVFCSARDMPRAGTEVHVRGMVARVLESTADGMPALVRFRFDTPLEAAERVWLVWQGQRPKPWTPPAIGQYVELAGHSPFESLPH